ncbi:MAG TPA: hypothetical protein VGK19_20835 [Capsulimonadaceae bacterium]|jgi:hypothetical protein
MVYFDQILQSLHRVSPIHYKPSFRVVSDADTWRIFDADRQLGLFRKLSLDIWAFSPFEPDEIANCGPQGSVIDLHTARNTFLNFGMQGWPLHWSADNVRWEWQQTAGDELIAVVSLNAREGETCAWRITVSYDAGRGSYIYAVSVSARKMDPAGFEGFNMMTAGALESRPERRRWTHSIWESLDGKLRRIVHSNALFVCTDYGGLRDGGGPWRGYHHAYPRAWVGYAAHPTFNPACLIHRTNVPLMGAICSALFDEHIVWTSAGQDQLEEDGYFHFQMDLEFVNIPPSLALHLLMQASDPVRPTKWWNEELALPFALGIENSFEDLVDPWLPEECPIFAVPRGNDGPVAWADDAAHSGTRSLRLKQAAEGRLALFPICAVCRVNPHHQYRLTAWVKTDGALGGAHIELAGYAYTHSNISHKASSVGISGSQDWTYLEVDIDSNDQAYVMPCLVLDGPGTAWFDDVCLTSIG